MPTTITYEGKTYEPTGEFRTPRQNEPFITDVSTVDDMKNGRARVSAFEYPSSGERIILREVRSPIVPLGGGDSWGSEKIYSRWNHTGGPCNLKAEVVDGITHESGNIGQGLKLSLTLGDDAHFSILPPDEVRRLIRDIQASSLLNDTPVRRRERKSFSVNG